MLVAGVYIGYALSSEEHAPADLVRNARLAEEKGFGYALISDHFHPWVDRLRTIRRSSPRRPRPRRP